MTCIAGIVDNDGTVYIGGDSAGVAGLDLWIRADKKVFKNGPFIMGFTSSFRMGQLLQHSLKPPKYYGDIDIEKFMVTQFINAVRTCLKDGGFAEKDKEVERGGTFLVGFNGKLFRIEGDYQVGESACNFDACGCGQSFAMGAFYATEGKPAKERVLTALEAAERFSAGVRRPFHVEVLGKQD
jgi:ATP-dependent protease HslVU (ClpYQ) peptidase subunit